MGSFSRSLITQVVQKNFILNAILPWTQGSVSNIMRKIYAQLVTLEVMMMIMCGGGHRNLPTCDYGWRDSRRTLETWQDRSESSMQTKIQE